MLRRQLSNGHGSNFGSLITMLAGSTELALEAETSAGWTDIIRLRLFRTAPAPWEPHWVQELLESPPDYTLFTSPIAVDGFVEILGPGGAVRGGIISIDPTTTSAAQRHGLTVAATAEVATVEALLCALEKDGGRTEVRSRDI
jgi:uroporphyrinogen-III synthase